MAEKDPPKQMSAEHNTFHAKRRRQRRDTSSGHLNTKNGKQSWRKRPQVKREIIDRLFIYGLHPVQHALHNPRRKKIKLYATQNGLNRLELSSKALDGLEQVDTTPRELDRMVGSEAVHQGVVLEVEPLKPKALHELQEVKLILLLDQVTDPHNVGAIMRSAVAMDAGALITTSRHSPIESGVLAKSASGAVDLIDHLEVRNLAETLETLSAEGFTTIGLDSEEAIPFEDASNFDKIALVLGAEGKGLREKTRKTCERLVKLEMPGAIKSLNVSNAAMLALYLARQKLT